MKSELISWPVTLAILVLAFGSLVAAGLPLMLTILGLVASAGSLYLGTQLLDISIWAMNFALMFALALGIDYALFIVMRFRGALFGSELSGRGRRRGDDGHRRQGGAVLRPDGADLAVGGDARPEPRVPLDGARDHALGRLRPRRDADPAAGRAGEARPAGRQARAAVGALRRAPLAALRALGRAALAPPAASTARRAARVLVAARAAGARARRPACRRSRSSRGATARASATTQVQAGVRRRRPRRAAARRAAGRRRARSRPSPRPTPASRRSCPPQPGATALALVQAIPTPDPSDPRRRRHDRPAARQRCPPARWSAAPAAENHDLEQALAAKTPLVIGVVLALGFLLLLVALQAPLIAAVGVAHEPARHRRRVRRRAADLPGRPPAPACSASSRRASSTPGGRCSSSR